MNRATLSYRSLGQICTKITDGTHQTPVYQDEGVVFISAKNIKNGQLDFADKKYISKQEHNFLTKSNKPTFGDLLLTKSGSLGDAVVIPELDFEFSIFESLALLKPKSENVDSHYLHQYLRSPAAAKYFQAITTGLAVKHLHLGDLRKLKVYLPPLRGQKEIAKLLSTWDSAIDRAERLIAAKEHYYTHECFRLISQEGHQHPYTLLANIATIWKGQQLNKDAMVDEGEYYVLNGGIGSSGNTTSWNCEANTVTISEGGNSCGFVNFNHNNFWCGGHCYALKNLRADVNAYYLFHYLKGRQQQIMALRVGSGLPNIQKADIEAFPVILPNLGKQVAIARYLNTLREEIAGLEIYAEKLRTQKRGLMQKLLTGQWRVNVSKEATHG